VGINWFWELENPPMSIFHPILASSFIMPTGSRMTADAMRTTGLAILSFAIWELKSVAPRLNDTDATTLQSGYWAT
jgi:hypothetical protein